MDRTFTGTISLDALEKAVIELLLQSHHPTLEILHQQYIVSTVLNRELTGVGFFTTFTVPNDIQRVDNHSFPFGDVVAEMDGLKHGAGFVLFVEKGKIHTLEGYIYEECWPKEIANLRLSYLKDKRDFSSLPKI